MGVVITPAPVVVHLCVVRRRPIVAAGVAAVRVDVRLDVGAARVRAAPVGPILRLRYGRHQRDSAGRQYDSQHLSLPAQKRAPSACHPLRLNPTGTLGEDQAAALASAGTRP